MDDAVLKLVLSVAAVAACAFAGRALARVDMRRSGILAETMDSLQLLRIHMLDGLMPLSAALKRSEGYILRGTGEMMTDISAAEAWHEFSCRQTARGGKLDSLAPADCDTLDRFFFSLGRSSREEQGRVFETAIKELGELEHSARESGARKHRLYTSLGALAGTALVIMLV